MLMCVGVSVHALGVSVAGIAYDILSIGSSIGECPALVLSGLYRIEPRYTAGALSPLLLSPFVLYPQVFS